jgi:hypothetical protein
MNKKQFDNLTKELLEAEEQYGTEAVSERFNKVACAENPDGLFHTLDEMMEYSEMKDNK